MKPVKKFTIVPNLPPKLNRLKKIAYNLWWSWDAEARDLFRRLDMDLWEKSGHNPVVVLNNVNQDILNSRADDDSYVYQLEKVAEKFDQFIESIPWYKRKNGFVEELQVAYFSMEYGITESLAFYSGGLGTLAGDHLKSASQLGIPLCGVGLSYQKGYFQQTLNVNGWQDEKYPTNDFYNMPMSIVKREDGSEIIVEIPFPDRKVYTRIWKIMVGTVPLYLLDTNIPENRDADRKITAELYGGDIETRIQQEIVLGFGGVRALNLIGLSNIVYHINEGHSAFSSLERIRKIVAENGLSFYEAMEVVKAGSVFTTHTPVKAGIDTFSPQIMKKYFEGYCKKVGITLDELLALGRVNASDKSEEFSMAILAINLSYKTNAVSKLHCKVAKKMWQPLWPEFLEKEVSIISVTNGAHHQSWVSKEMSDLFDRYIGPRWSEEPADKSLWEKVHDIPDGELWRTHERRRERLISFARKKLQERYYNCCKTESEIRAAKNVLNPESLTIGFARRFALYKRGTLILRNIEKLESLLTNKERPIQIIFSGKAHPKDEEGKELISKILALSDQEPFKQHIVFIEDYNINVARYMVQGCDVWLNNPRRGFEACGTSGMKAVSNGGLHFSTLDGWWDEIYKPGVGWAIGRRVEYSDFDYWDEQDANALYELLEKEIIPLFYDRDSSGLPSKWISMMKESIIEICPVYNTNRMLSEYTSELYYPSTLRKNRLQENDYLHARELASWKKKVKEQWNSIRFLNVELSDTDNLSIDSKLKIKAEIYLGQLSSDDVDVQIYYGKVNSDDMIENGEIVSMDVESNDNSGKYSFTGEINNWNSGLNGFTIRMIPKHEYLDNPSKEGLIHWLK